MDDAVVTISRHWDAAALWQRASARYIVEVSFEKDDAKIQVLAVKTGDAWRNEGFHINSSALMKRMVGLKSCPCLFLPRAAGDAEQG